MAIHAAKKKVNLWEVVSDHHIDGIFEALNKEGIDPDDLPRGCLLGKCDRIVSNRIWAYQQNCLEEMLGDWTPGRYSWEPIKMRALEAPIPFRGRQGVFNVPDCLLSNNSNDRPENHKQLKLF